MRCPSVKALCATFRDLTREQALLIRKLAKRVDDRERFEAVLEKYCPDTVHLRGGLYSYNGRVEVALGEMDRLLGTHGVEALPGQDHWQDFGDWRYPPWEYLNAGDPYVATLIYTRMTNTLRIGCWGDIVERHDRKGEW